MRRTFLFITVIVSVFFLCFFAHATTFTVESINSYIELDIITPLRDANYSETAMTLRADLKA